MKKLLVNVIGLGYIGLPTAAILARTGHNVLGVDIDTHIIDKVNKGITHISEPGLNDLLQSVVSQGMLSASISPNYADVFVIAVPTPFSDSNNNKEADLSYLYKAVDSIIPYLKSGNLILIESTCPVGTTELVSSYIDERTKFESNDLLFAYCPERVLPGDILSELENNDRVIGGLNENSTKVGLDFYSSFCKGKLLSTNARTAELVKLTENSYRDVNIAFANEISMICSDLSIDSNELINLANHHPRVNILRPGCGVGGHCIAVDPWFIVSTCPENSKLIRVSRDVNSYKPLWVVDKVKKDIYKLEKSLKRKVKVCCMGLTFKPDVEDLRESPALFIANKLSSLSFDIHACEPNLETHPTINLLSLEVVLKNMDLLVFLVSHSQFKNLECDHLNTLDFCGVLNS